MQFDLFLQSFLCIVFALLGVSVRGFFSRKKTNWREDITFAFVIGLVIFFGKAFLLKTWTDQFSVSAVCGLLGIVGPVIFKKLMQNPLAAFAIFSGRGVSINENENEKK